MKTFKQSAEITFECCQCGRKNHISVNPDLITVESMLWMGRCMQALREQNNHLVDLNRALMDRLKGEGWKS